MLRRLRAVDSSTRFTDCGITSDMWVWNLVPAVGLNFQGQLKLIAEKGDFLYPVRQLSDVFRGKLLQKLKHQLKKTKQLTAEHQKSIDKCYAKDWVVQHALHVGSCPTTRSSMYYSQWLI